MVLCDSGRFVRLDDLAEGIVTELGNRLGGGVNEMKRHDEPLRTSDLANPVKEDELRVEAEADLTVAERDASAEADEAIVLDSDPSPSTQAAMSLVEEGDRKVFLSRWKQIQSEFVDEPRGAVSHADGLVADLMQHLARSFADVRGDLEAQWDREENVSTEDLRVALQRYRAFFNRLLET
jgi:hypothetical protein